ncbi:MAG: tRNA 2-thiocytidine(32) synthetase TtcA, partial [Methylomonas sp.]
ENLQRVAMKKMLTAWDKQFPGRLETIFASLQNIAPSQMADTQLFDFMGLKRDLAATANPRISSDDPSLDILER